MARSVREKRANRTVEHYTPPFLLDVVRRYALEVGRTNIELDPATDHDNWTGADRIFTAAEDGLSRSWPGFWFVNPPYGTALRAWVEHAAAQARGELDSFGVALLPGQRFEQRYVQETLLNPEVVAAEVAITGRMDFYGRVCRSCGELEGHENHEDNTYVAGVTRPDCVFSWSGLRREGVGNPYGSFLYLMGRGHELGAARKVFREVGAVSRREWTEPFRPLAGSCRFNKGMARRVKGPDHSSWRGIPNRMIAAVPRG